MHTQTNDKLVSIAGFIMKRKIKPGKIVTSSALGLVGVAFLAVLVAANVVAGHYDDVLSAAFGASSRSYSSVNYSGVNPIYYSSGFSSSNDLEKAHQSFSKQLCEEGITVLEKGNLPYDKGTTKLSLFSRSSVDFIYGGTGSGAATGDVTLKGALEQAGFSINPTLWNFYSSGKGSKYNRGIGSINYGDSDDYAINEVPLSLLTSDGSLVSSFSSYDTAAFVLSRTGGEGNDLARGMDDYVDTGKDQDNGKHPDADGDKKRSYLEPDSIELETLSYLNDHFKDVILFVNCNNAMELGWTKNYSHLRTIIQVPGTGESGLEALGEILSGTIASSGHLTDTIAYDAFSSPAMQNFGDFQFTCGGKAVPNYGGNHTFDGYYYVDYQEGMYVGYRYYESRYEDCVLQQNNAAQISANEVGASKSAGLSQWDYRREVQYPFGYGASLAQFAWSGFQLTQNGDDFLVTTSVSNVGAYPGKDVVELYAQTPYGDYEKAHHIDKASLGLLGFQKTALLQPGEKQTVSISFSKEDLKSYDDSFLKGYYLSQGRYYFTLASDAHAAINNILRKKGVSVSSLCASPSENEAGNPEFVSDAFSLAEPDLTSYQNDSTTGVKVSNLFDFASLNAYEKDANTLRREDWCGSYPAPYGKVSTTPSKHSERINSGNGTIEGYQYQHEISADGAIYQGLMSYDSLNPATSASLPSVRWNESDVDLELADLRGLSYDDPAWSSLLSRMSLSEAISLAKDAGYKTASVASIHKPVTADRDGPAGLNTVSGHFKIGYTYPCALLIAETWNPSLAESKGNLIGEDCLKSGVSGWYGPAENLHRTPFGGRNFEYYSEDPIISATMAKGEVIGSAKKGVFAYLKHFAFNNQETHREKEGGLCTYVREQAIRELYLKAFEGVIKGNWIDEDYYAVTTDGAGHVVLGSNGEPIFSHQTTKVNACSAVMSSFVRLGQTWAGGCYPLITSLLEKEWGFRGAVLTDYYHSWFMSNKQAVQAGGSLVLDPEKNAMNCDANDTLFQSQIQQAAHRTLYCVANSNAMNGYVHGVTEQSSWPTYKTYLIYLDIGLALLSCGCGVGIYFLLRPAKRKGDDAEVSGK